MLVIIEKQLHIVNNGSLDNSLHEIEQFLNESFLSHHVEIIRIDENLGFAGGNLQGLKHANGEYIALLNNDTEPGEDWLRNLVLAMDLEPLVGICASKIIVYDTDTIDSAGVEFYAFLRSFNKREGEKISMSDTDKNEYVFGLC